jgi:hypothetical protein
MIDTYILVSGQHEEPQSNQGPRDYQLAIMHSLRLIRAL